MADSRMGDQDMRIYFAGSFYKSIDDYIIHHHGARLLSYAYPRDVEKYCERIRNIGPYVSQDLIIDSGAFSVWNNNKSIDICEYIKFARIILNKYGYLFRSFHIVTLDVIPGEFGRSPSKEERKNAVFQGFKNLELMCQQFDNDYLIHVFHMYEDFDIINEILKAVDYIGISPSNYAELNLRRKWFDQVFHKLSPGVKTHGFGMTSIPLMNQFPWYSVDSTSAKITAGYGKIMTPFGIQHVSSRDGKSILNEKEYISKGILDYIEEMGANPDMLKSDSDSRHLFNTRFLICEEARMNENGKSHLVDYKRKQEELF